MSEEISQEPERKSIEVQLTEITGAPTKDEQTRYHALEFATRVNNFETTTEAILNRAEKFREFLAGSETRPENSEDQ
jgi:hypothetical protein